MFSGFFGLFENFILLGWRWVEVSVVFLGM